MNNLHKQFISSGFVVCNITDQSLLGLISNLIKPQSWKCDSSHQTHHTTIKLHQDLLNQSRVHILLARNLLDSLRSLIGNNDFAISSTIYLRSVRPSSSSTLIVEHLPWHREIFYSDYDYANHQINIHIPIFNYTSHTAMQYIPLSHNIPDSSIQTSRLSESVSGVSRFSTAHSIGLPYAPKIITNLSELGIPTYCPATIGQAFIFNSRLIHGAGVNTSRNIRFSLDFSILPKRFLTEQKDYHFASYNNGDHFIPFTPEF